MTKYPTASSGKKLNAPEEEYMAANVYHETFLVSKKVPSEVCGDAERVLLKFWIHLREKTEDFPDFATVKATEEAIEAEGGAIRGSRMAEDIDESVDYGQE